MVVLPSKKKAIEDIYHSFKTISQHQNNHMMKSGRYWPILLPLAFFTKMKEESNKFYRETW